MDRGIGRTTVSKATLQLDTALRPDLTNSKRPSFYPDPAPLMDLANHKQSLDQKIF